MLPSGIAAKEKRAGGTYRRILQLVRREKQPGFTDKRSRLHVILNVTSAMKSESELERLLRERTEELEAVNAALRKSEQALAAETDAVERMQHVATHLINSEGVEALYEQILATTMA